MADYNITSNLSNLIIREDCSITWADAIRGFCTGWKQYLGNYDFYIICIWIYIIAGIIKIFWNFRVNNTYYIDDKPIKIDFDLMQTIKDISIGALIIRIFQLYYISKLYLGV